LPNTVPQASNGDYDGTGYARGHMCPSSDRTVDATDNLSTFVFTNVVPQLPNLNNGPWKGLENEERQLVKNGKTLYITSGPLGGSTRLGTGVLIPTATWKVIVVLDAPGTAASVTTQTRVISVIMKNDASTTASWDTYRTTVRDIEAQTGLDLLSDVASSVQDVVETRVDTGNPQGG
jgi:endonuclease G